MRDTNRQAIWILIMIATGLAPVVYSAPGQKMESCRLPAAPGETLVVENDFGRIRVIPWDQPEVEAGIRVISPHAERLGNVTVACASSHTTHFIRAGFFDYQAESVYLDIKAPGGINLVVWGANPAVEVAGLHGQVRVQTLTGRITAEDLTGLVSLQSQGGSILFQSGTQPHQDILLGTGSGAVTCRIAPGLNLRGWLRAGGRISWNRELELSRGFLEKQVGVGGPLLAATSDQGSITITFDTFLPSADSTEFGPLPGPVPVAKESSEVQSDRRVGSAFPESAAAGDSVVTSGPDIAADGNRSPGEAEPPYGGFTVKVNVDWVYVNASVRERQSGRAVPDLTVDQFELREDGNLQRIEKFDSTEAPFSLVLLLDVSGSTKSFLDMVKEASIAFTRRLNPGDRVAVATFNSRTRLRQDFTSDRNAVADAIRGIRSGGGTAFYDALHETVTRFLAGVEGRQAVVVFSDGVDNQLTGDVATGSRTRFRDLYREVQDGDALIYTIFLDSEDEFGQISRRNRRTPGGILGDIILGRGGWGGRADPAYREAREQLQIIADQTGARMYAPGSAAELSSIFTEIANDLRVQYTLGYSSNNPRRDGQWRELQVRIRNRPDFEVRARRGYYAGREAEAKLKPADAVAANETRRSLP